ncbi:YjjI family glycine radical enzyme [Ferrimonas marina]|uniref:Glycine radical enzyme, YjjI family n=1 Tax=Ferrimonas marina TaxID=299255 RepID=A0A1M5Z548_9GAMM|nr:YjjI family glycine radical enzyme [Ferrimonas marina]SHI19311.1 glycine radical enzyme, YjjI family [Ferrimonas marina]
MSLESLQQQAMSLIQNPSLTPQQKQLALYQTLEAALPACSYSPAVAEAVEQGLLHEMFESAAPFKPRYLLPDYQKALQLGSEYLELAAPSNLDEAIQFLLVLYQSVPSVTTYPVFVGHIDQLLEPFVSDQLTDQQLDDKIRRFWQAIDRTLPDSFVHANLGPADSRIGRSVLRVDAQLAQSVPNLTFRYQEGVTPADLLSQLSDNIVACNKPHIANHQMISRDFDGDYGQVSCYNSLPIGGGAHTMMRLNLRQSFFQCDGSIDDYLANTVPHCTSLMVEAMSHRIDFLVERSGFYQGNFLATEGLISLDRFSAMFGIYGLAELVNQLLEAKGSHSRYGHDEEAMVLAEQIVAAYQQQLRQHRVKHCQGERLMFHSQSGISSDSEETAGTRIPIGEEPDAVSYIRRCARLHRYFDAGISDIFVVEPTIANNPSALTRLIRGGLQLGLRCFTANVSNNDLVRITGYLVKRSDIDKLRQGAERHQSTVLGAEAVDVAKILDRRARIISHETVPLEQWR